MVLCKKKKKTKTKNRNHKGTSNVRWS